MRRAAWLALLFAAASAWAQKPAMWRLEELANSPAPAVTLHKGAGRTQVGVISTSRARLIVDAKARLEQAAGVGADLVLVEGSQPNAFSTPTSKAGPLVGLNLGMVELLGDDADAYAALLGHEYAHLTLRHRESRVARESLRLLGTTVLSIALASQGAGRGAADVANFATQAVSMTFSREEERDADRTGLRYAAAAGFDPHGAVRVWERMAAGGERTVPFLSSHPASAERVENMRALAAEFAGSPAVSEVEYSFEGVRIHGVLLAESHSGLVVMETPPGARTTLMPGDRVVGCYGQAPQPLHVASLAWCRSPEGGYAFLVERGGGQVAAVVLKKGSGPFY
jgi:predicted Zn-dependent protease